MYKFNKSVWKARSSRPEMFCKKCLLENFANFTGIHLCQSLFLIKLQAGGCFCEAKKNFKENNQKYKHCCVHEIFCLFLDRFFLNILQLTHCLSFFYININKKRTYYINKIDKKKKLKE